MSAFLVDAVRSAVPDPVLWAFAGAASCCGGLALGLYWVNPLAFEILMAEEDDEDAINKAIGQSVLDKFAPILLGSALVGGAVSFAEFDTPISITCCAASCIGMGCTTAHCKFQDIQQVAESMAQEKKRAEWVAADTSHKHLD